MSQVTAITFDNVNEVTLYVEGKDPQGGRHEAGHRMSRRAALAVLRCLGAAPGCRVRTAVSRSVYVAPDATVDEARGFAELASLPFVERVRFPVGEVYPFYQDGPFRVASRSWRSKVPQCTTCRRLLTFSSGRACCAGARTAPAWAVPADWLSRAFHSRADHHFLGAPVRRAERRLQ